MSEKYTVKDVGGYIIAIEEKFANDARTADAVISSYEKASEDKELSDIEARYFDFVYGMKLSLLKDVRDPGIFSDKKEKIALFYCPTDRLTPDVFSQKHTGDEDGVYKKLPYLYPDGFKGLTHFERLVQTYKSGCPCRLTEVTSNPLYALYHACKAGCGVYVLAVPESEISYPGSDKALMLSCLPLLSFAQRRELYGICGAALSAKRFRQLKGGSRYLDDAPEELFRQITTEKPFFKREADPADLLRPLYVAADRSDRRAFKEDIYYVISGLCESEAEAERKLKADVAAEFLPDDCEKILKQLSLLGINGAALSYDLASAAEYLK